MKQIRSAVLAAAMILGAAVLAPAPASATSFCHPKATTDGFVALRAGPSPTARLIGRMRPQDEVLFGQERKGDWVEATWWRGDDRLNRGYTRFAGKGWVNAKLIEDEC